MPAPSGNGPVPTPLVSDQRKRMRVVEFAYKGRGVVALEPIAEGELIERAPVLLVPRAHRTGQEKGILKTHAFAWVPDPTEGDLFDLGLALGYVSLLNHAADPNAAFAPDFPGLWIDVAARRAIAAGEEITIDYDMTLDFEPA